jgi:hypothetical protein
VSVTSRSRAASRRHAPSAWRKAWFGSVPPLGHLEYYWWSMDVRRTSEHCSLQVNAVKAKPCHHGANSSAAGVKGNITSINQVPGKVPVFVKQNKTTAVRAAVRDPISLLSCASGLRCGRRRWQTHRSLSLPDRSGVPIQSLKTSPRCCAISTDTDLISTTWTPALPQL